MSTYNDTEEHTVSTDDDDEAPPPIDQVAQRYPDDEEFDPYDSGLNDFTFEDNAEGTE